MMNTTFSAWMGAMIFPLFLLGVFLLVLHFRRRVENGEPSETDGFE